MEGVGIHHLPVIIKEYFESALVMVGYAEQQAPFIICRGIWQCRFGRNPNLNLYQKIETKSFAPAPILKERAAMIGNPLCKTIKRDALTSLDFGRDWG